MMIRACFIFSLFGLSAALTQLRSSIVFTTPDVLVNQPQGLSGLYQGVSYSVFAVYASGYSDTYAQNVWIYDTYGYRYNLYTLSRPLSGSGYILDSTYYLRAPITIHDQNTGASRIPFTFYLVDRTVPYYPVVSAQYANGQVDSYRGIYAAGVTVLSAEKYFTMYSFDIGTLPNMYITSVGFDDPDSQYRLMYLGSSNEAWISFLTVYGPITTLFNSNFGSSRFQFQLTKNSKYGFTLSPGASTALLSPGFLSPKQQPYKIPYTVTEAFDQSYTFATNNYVSADYQTQDVSPSTILFRFTSSDGQNRDYTSNYDESTTREEWANRISLSVQNTNDNHYPRFIYKIKSGSALSFSLLGMLLAVFFSKFY